ncbi:MAG TPA: YrdB family protein [Chitinophagaceae bacterium]|nr:YrdB family protein [Chitinophagaceae bacterium]
MSNHPLNLALRFLLELVILYSLGAWAWKTQQGWLRYLGVIAVPLLAAAAWGIFRTPADHGKGLVATPGILRLALELVLFAAATWGLREAGYPRWALAFGAVTLAHYALSYDRVLLLLRH